MLRKVFTIAGKELTGFFSSLAALLFLGAFIAVTLFVFFWASTFFARDLADVRPLFQWMPVLLIFLVAALTMRAWAEERRAGTVELLLTAPTAPVEQVLGKFLGIMGLVLVALVLTLPLPISVAFMGSLDWGPVIGGYIASLALAAAYVAIGLWVSCRTDNQIVSLIVTVVIAGALYLIGSDTFTALVGYRAAEWLHALGAGSRFASITRGVLDLRDLYYYLSITAVFLVLNRLSLEKLRWANNAPQPGHRRWYWITALLAANALGANLWLDQISWARLDLTSGHLYTLSDATRSYLGQLQEPLLIRGYFSAETHPLLAPLVPQLRDLLQEYAVAGGSKVQVQFVDPHDDPKVEAEAGSRYGIRPVPFQVASKYQASVVNSYFNILLSYGDQYQVLNFRDLIDVKQASDTDLHVQLKNPEYAITSALRKILVSYQGGGGVFDTLQQPLTFTAYLSDDNNLPKQLQQAHEALTAALTDIRKDADGKFQFGTLDPDSNTQLASRLQRDYGFRPMMLSLLDTHSFWFYMTLNDGKRTEQVPLPANLDQAAFKNAVNAAIKRFSPGFLKTVAVLASGNESYSTLRTTLGNSVRWLDADLKNGRVPVDADMLMVLDPQSLDAKQVFAIDQFLMKGGSVMVATSPQDVSINQSITGTTNHSGLHDWLAGYGLTLGKQLVMDEQSGALPIPVQRNIGGFIVNEVQLAQYPYIVDVRDAGLNNASPITSSLGQLYMPWAAPISVDNAQNKGRKLTTLVSSSSKSWLADANDLMPDYSAHPQLGFATGSKRQAQPLAVMLEGRFNSAFKGKNSPLLSANNANADQNSGKPKSNATKADTRQSETSKSDASKSGIDGEFNNVIDHSPDSARLILIGSSAMFNDQVAQLITQTLGTQYLKPQEFAQNIVDWSLEDQGLLSIRSRELYARTLAPMSRSTQEFWEYLNYALALGGLAVIWLLNRRRRHYMVARHLKLLAEV
jgi:ABC-2 type transport system permease protein